MLQLIGLISVHPNYSIYLNEYFLVRPEGCKLTIIPYCMQKKYTQIYFIAVIFLSISVYTFAQNPSCVPTSGLVGWWPFNGNANDESGNGNNGTVYGATLTTDRFGNGNQAYSFDAAQNNYFGIPHNASLNFQSNNTISISIWIKSTISSPVSTDMVFISKQIAALVK